LKNGDDLLNLLGLINPFPFLSLKRTFSPFLIVAQPGFAIGVSTFVLDGISQTIFNNPGVKAQLREDENFQ